MADSYVNITKSGFEVFSWKDGNYQRIEGYPFSSHLKQRIQLADDLELIDVLRHVDQDRKMLDFFKHYSHCSGIKKFHKEAFKESFITEESFQYLEIFWLSEVMEGFINCNPGFHAKGIDENDQYSLMFMPLHTYAHLPIKLNKEITFYSWDHATPTVVLQANKEFTLLEFLHGIYWEVSFNGGSPTERNKSNKKLKDIK